MYVDAHCHIDRYPRPAEVLAAAQRARVVTVAVTETPAAFQSLRVKAGKRPMLRVALGLHPLSAARIGRHEVLLFRRLIDRTDYIGEVGLDFSRRGEATRARQLELFEGVLAEPSIRRKVLTVHSLRAERETVTLLAESGAHAILHWYTGALKHLETALDAGMWFSVNSAMLASRKGQRILAALPRERVLTETDGPYTRLNGHTNDPSGIPALTKSLAKLWNEDLVVTRRRLFENMAALHLAATDKNAETSQPGVSVLAPAWVVNSPPRGRSVGGPEALRLDFCDPSPDSQL